MRKFCHIFCFIILLLYFHSNVFAEYSEQYNSPNQSHSQPNNQIRFTNSQRELIIRLHPNISSAELIDFNRSLGVEASTPVFNQSTPAGKHPMLSRYYLIQFPIATNLQQVIQQYVKHPLIDNVQINRLNQFCTETNPNDPRYSEQWNLRTINLPKAWNIESGNPSIIVAVVDSGIKKEHPELKNQLWRNQAEIAFNGIDDDQNGYVDDIQGWDFSDAPTLQGVGDSTQRDNDPEDETGHGTHVSGIIAAEANNGIGIAGITWNCQLMPLRAGFRLAGGGAFLQNDDVAAAIVYAADNGAQIINLSLGDTVNTFIIQDAVQYAYNKGCIIIAAAGNSAEPGAYYPAALKTVVSVASVDNNLHLGSSNFGSSIDIAAPGEDILSTDIAPTGWGYAVRSGTSMATAHVSGIAALLISANPSCSNTEIKEWLIGTARQLSITDLVGSGLVDAYDVLTEQIGLTAHISTNPSPQNDLTKNMQNVELIGSAGGREFTQFWIDYGISETPDLWFQVAVPETEPMYNTILHVWNTSELDPGIYTLRLSVKAENGQTIRDKVVVEIRHKHPQISNHESGVWLSGNTYDSTIIWQTDVLSTGIVEIFAKNDKDNLLRSTRSDSVNLQHIVYLSETGLSAGEYLYQLKSQNRTGILNIDDNDNQFYPIIIRENQINTTHLQQTASALMGFHGIPTTIDTNNNGKIELIGVLTDTTNTSTAPIFEIDDDGNLAVISTIDQQISRLWDAADTDGDGLIEILCSNSTRTSTITFLLEQPTQGEYPTERIWEVEGNWGGKIADIDLDGKPEICTRHDATNAISIYEAIQNNRYINITELENPTQGMNIIGTKFAIGDFDADGLNEIIAGDNDGDVFIYESIGDNLYQPTWIDVLPDSIPLLFAAGDMDGDGISEFAIGAKAWTVGIDLPRQHWLFVIYKSNGNDSYRPVWYQRIRELQDGESGMTIADANSDGKNDLCIVVSPNFYLIQYDGKSYQPIWHHPATSTFNPIVADINSDGINELLFNAGNILTGFENTRSDDTIIPPTTTVPVVHTAIPHLVSAQHAAPHQLLLTFDKPMSNIAAFTSRYKLHRQKQHNGNNTDNNQTDDFTPQSAILDRSRKRVMLTFSNGVFLPDYSYEIETFQLSDIYGAEISDDERTIAVQYTESHNAGITVYPNPARGNQVKFDKLPAGSIIHIYDIAGKRIASLDQVDESHTGNRCSKIWSIRDVSSGIYLYTIETESERKIGKISVLK